MDQTEQAYAEFDKWIKGVSRYLSLDEGVQDEFDSVSTTLKAHLYGYYGQHNPWQPIETAPKDGDAIMVAYKGQYGVWHYFEAWWIQTAGDSGWFINAPNGVPAKLANPPDFWAPKLNPPVCT